MKHGSSSKDEADDDDDVILVEAVENPPSVSEGVKVCEDDKLAPADEQVRICDEFIIPSSHCSALCDKTFLSRHRGRCELNRLQYMGQSKHVHCNCPVYTADAT